MTTFYQGDNINIMKRHIVDKSIDLIYFNPPFGTTQNKWDEKLDWKEIFAQCFRCLKDNGVLVIHCSVPFNYTLIREAPKAPTYSWYWKKDNNTNPLIAKIQPLRNTEEILVWTNKKVRYYPQRVGDEERTYTPHGGKGTGYYCSVRDLPAKTIKGKLRTHHIEMKRSTDGYSTRPHELIELIINSYTMEGDTILDPTCYKGICGLISKNMGRKWIGIDKYFIPSLLM
jgi:DNA modification methylase